MIYNMPIFLDIDFWPPTKRAFGPGSCRNEPWGDVKKGSQPKKLYFSCVSCYLATFERMPPIFFSWALPIIFICQQIWKTMFQARSHKKYDYQLIVCRSFELPFYRQPSFYRQPPLLSTPFISFFQTLYQDFKN